ncbi:hypothetical protein DLM75_20920 [Leptospira stimsonii]|uniref:Uncharacterized protein n=2 Tax=Leptospira stimsonii TaxID=2202203 RepID=A0A396YQZ9_9LEPT|nr:hypothetical protein DLM75_20920 [Leptospira stimsonii]
MEEENDFSRSFPILRIGLGSGIFSGSLILEVKRDRSDLILFFFAIPFAGGGFGIAFLWILRAYPKI